MRRRNLPEVRHCDAGQLAMQCCPMDTYGTDSAGDLRPECTCGDDCDCMCADCICARWGEEYDDYEPDPGYCVTPGCDCCGDGA